MNDCDLRLGRWQDVLADVECDTLISDPPYSARTHEGQRHGRHKSQDGKSWISARGLGYGGWTSDDVREFVESWSPRVRGWFVVLTDSELYSAFRDALADAGRVVFAPIPVVQRGMNVRLAGDGPSNWTVWLVVARTSAVSKWGTTRGVYIGSAIDPGEMLRDKSERACAGAKPLWIPRALVRDYSRAGDLVCDPCAGGGTTLLAARMEGRRAVGAEVDADTHAVAARRLANGYTIPMFVEGGT